MKKQINKDPDHNDAQSKPVVLSAQVDFIREWLPQIQVARASRPGQHQSQRKIQAALDLWIRSVVASGFKSIVCLLSGQELALYSHLDGGLLGQYERNGIESVSIPIPIDRSPVLTGGDRAEILDAFLKLPKPIVIHCSAGIVRSGAAVRFLEARSLAARGSAEAGEARP